MVSIRYGLIVRLFASLACTFLLVIAGFFEPLLAQTNVPGAQNAAPGPTKTGSPDKPAAYGSSTLVNIFKTWTPKQPYTVVSTVQSSQPVSQVGLHTEYLDAFVRPLQEVDWQVSPTGNDLVTPHVYDAYGREADKFLDYIAPASTGGFRNDPFDEQSSFYSSTYLTDQPTLKNEEYYYSNTQYELSPQGRIDGIYGAGNSWVGSNRGKLTQYLLNNSTDLVQLWRITSSPLTYINNDVGTNIPTSTTVYGNDQLTKTVTIDENGNQIVEFQDQDGLTVMKKTQVGVVTAGNPYTNWLCTYYVYDDFGLLRFVIPPKAVAAMVSANSWTLTPDMINELCYRYEYDDRKRKIASKVPGAGWRYIVYDQKDRPILAQDANIRANNQWLATIYDNLDRTTETGMLTYSSGPVNLQSYENGNTGLITLSGEAVTGDYPDNSIPPNLSEPTRVAGQTQYLASNSIVFQPGFTSEAGANFVAEIVQGGSSYTTTSVAFASDNPLPSGANFIALTMNYYDKYTTSKTYTTANNSKLDQGTNTYADALPSTASVLTMGELTSSKVRVIENANDLTQGIWLETANFYDDKGRVVQVQHDNYKGGVDNITSRYDFLNKVVCTYSVHNNPAASVSNLSIKTNTDYDAAGRMVEALETINDNTAQTRILEYDQYDPLGKLKVKKTGEKCDVNGNPIVISNPSGDNTDWLEVDSYAYNIVGLLKGMNWNYAAGPTSSTVNPQNNIWFGMDLSYDWGFSANQYNGDIAGQRWMSATDGKERAMGYTYDLSGRLLRADFTQNFGDGTSPNWSTSDPKSSFKIDFSVKMGDGSTVASAYDANGNILQMQQSGLVLNTSQPIDNLAYTYENGGLGNKLRAVADNSGSTAQLGDFQDNNTTADDYGYDLNGNQITDLNRRIGTSIGVDQTSGGGIVYSYLNLPWQITINNPGSGTKGTITYIYDAKGMKLEKRVNELPSSSNNQTTINTVTTYLGGYVYRNNALQYFTQTDGRVRPISGASTPFVFDYLIKDHLGNTRVVLTDQQNTINPPVATVEETPTASLTTEESYFNINPADITSMPNDNYPNNNGNPPYNTNPNSNTSATSQYMYRLNGQNGDKTGLGITLKVMAGDKVNIWGRTYYHLNTTVNNNFPIAPAGVSAFLAAFAGTPVIEAMHNITAASLQSSPVTPSDVTSLLENLPIPASTPKAYINWILFDEQFRPVTTGTNSGYIPIGNTAADAYVLSPATATITTSGYLYIYCSNESNIDVYFDNLQVQQIQGPLLEDQHYYPFGLQMAAISDMATMPQNIENLYRFQGQELQHKEFSDGSGLEMYTYKHRFDDPQTGRFGQIDPLADQYVYNSTYAFSGNQVTTHIELDGKEPWQQFVANMYRSAGITSSTDPQQYVYQNVIVPLADPRTWLEGYAMAGGIIGPLALTHIMTEGTGDRYMLEAEMSTLRAGMTIPASSSLVSEPLGEQWGTAGLFADNNRANLILGTRQGYWGNLIDNAQSLGVNNIAANEPFDGYYYYLDVNVDLDWNNPASRQFFFDNYNKPILDKAIARGDNIIMLDNPYNINAIFPGGDVSKGFNFYGMEVEYLTRLGFTFDNGIAIYPGALDPNWHAPMVLPGTMNTGTMPDSSLPTGAGNDQGVNNDDGGDDGGGDQD